jgi:ATP-dependent Clp protease, protease subunit
MSRSTESIQSLHDYDLDLKNRIIYMGSGSTDSDESGVDAALASRVIKNLTLLETAGNKPITVLFNSVGGEVEHGLAIYDRITACSSQVTIKVFGSAQSMGSVILQAADERILARNAVIMLHYGSLQVEGHTKSVQKIVDHSKHLDRAIEKIYLSRIHEKIPTYSLKKLRRCLDHDTFLTPEEAIKFGLADKVL